jgi:predicted nuclease of predicted toxin-antitoxin system
MRVLIDECLNWRLGRALTGHYTVSAQKMGWSGITNGKLLALAVENGFDVFLTGDRNLTFQQNITEFSIAIVVLEAKGIQLHHTLPLIPQSSRATAYVKAGKSREVGSLKQTLQRCFAP